MARILGLDLGARSVKALLVESTLRGSTVKSWVEQKIDASTGLKGALLALKEAKQLQADQVVVAVPGTAATMQLLTLPFADARRVEQTIGFEVEGQLPYDISEVVFDHQTLEVRDGKSEVLVSTVRKAELAGLLELLSEVGVDPRVVTTSALAYQPLLAAGLTGHPGAPAEGAEAILDIGHERTSVLIGHAKGGLEHARTFSGGGLNLDRAVAAEFQVSLADAEAWKENEGDVDVPPGAAPEVERAAAALNRGFAPILREIRATFRAHAARGRKPVARVYLTGGTARLKGLEAMLARQLGVEVVRLDPVPAEANAGVLTPSDVPLAAQAWALTQRASAAQRGAKLNLRKGEFAFKGDLDYLKGKVSKLAAFAAVLLLLAILSVWARFHALSTREKEIDAILCHTTQRVLGQCQKDYLVTLSLLKGKGSAAAALPSNSALDLFAELTTRMQTLNVTMQEAEVQLERIRFRGETDSFDSVDKLVDELGKYRCFQEIKRGKVQKGKDGSKVQFDLDIRVQCPEGGARPDGA